MLAPDFATLHPGYKLRHARARRGIHVFLARIEGSEMRSGQAADAAPGFP